MEEKKYSIRELKKFNNTYNQMIDFLKNTISEENKSEMMDKFEKRAFEEDRKTSWAKVYYGVNGLATIATTLAGFTVEPGAFGATLVTAPYTFMYYLLYKHSLLEGKNKKEECLRFMQSISEKEHNIRYPFSVGDYNDLDKMQEYSKLIKDMKGEDLANYFRQMYEDKSL